VVFGLGKEAVTFFEKKVTKKTFAPLGAGTGVAFNRHRWWRLKALPIPAPTMIKSFLRRTRGGAFFQNSAAFYL
jgi:hypothetical protein